MGRVQQQPLLPVVERNRTFDGCGRNDECYDCRTARRGRELNATRERCLAQRTLFDPWTQAVMAHDWIVEDPGPCDGCHQNDPQRLRINAGKLSLCAKCLSEFFPFWPTGSPKVQWKDLVAHLEKCILHASFPTTPRTASLRVEPTS